MEDKRNTRFEGFESGLGWFKDAMDQSKRRECLGKMMNEHKLSCPECKTRQVQLVGYINIHPAQWKCRHCKEEFVWEGDMVDSTLTERVEEAENR